MMHTRTTITIQNENFVFLSNVAGDNRSAYIDDLLSRERIKLFQQKILQANLEEAADIESQAELADWEITVGDGLADE